MGMQRERWLLRVWRDRYCLCHWNAHRQKCLPQSLSSSSSARKTILEMNWKFNLKIHFFHPFFLLLLLNIKAIFKLILLAHKVLLSSGAWREWERREERHTGMKAKCINSPPILLLCCDRLSNMQAHFLCQRLDGGSQERPPWVSLKLPRSLSDSFFPAL